MVQAKSADSLNCTQLLCQRFDGSELELPTIQEIIFVLFPFLGDGLQIVIISLFVHRVKAKDVMLKKIEGGSVLLTDLAKRE